ncbi:hypothetical protein MKX01_010840 [Papaver californicum]|nr:hypothetical protein MKX01_010840 [Papaver californicum]
MKRIMWRFLLEHFECRYSLERESRASHYSGVSFLFSLLEKNEFVYLGKLCLSNSLIRNPKWLVCWPNKQSSSSSNSSSRYLQQRFGENCSNTNGPRVPTMGFVFIK